MANNTHRLVLGIFILLFLTVSLVPAFAENQTPATGEEALINTFERLEEWRTWEIRRELHRIHHHLEYMPIMVFTHVGIMLVLTALLVVKIKEYKKS
ncbi:hypothetical protein [Spirochaeta africana]|uniref:Uncharacterized protein n=1 Tax=Spirochaeta africana (strain ATCC 700263 / DSM 8902 / Z-7692) TaxID=889378 RepID=H9UHR6_SPIAZ|nr:hypothetical protein [Spirochaeta africana]AFG37059.1 hypothetical protein Spiaf_0970 [Spirochaeta africana DSM 8902]